MPLANRVKELRAAKGLNQQELGALVGAVAVEAGVCMNDPCTRRMMMRKGKKMVRLAQNIGQKFM